jgi:hypothetical protein
MSAEITNISKEEDVVQNNPISLKVDSANGTAMTKKQSATELSSLVLQDFSPESVENDLVTENNQIFQIIDASHDNSAKQNEINEGLNLDARLKLVQSAKNEKKDDQKIPTFENASLPTRRASFDVVSSTAGRRRSFRDKVISNIFDPTTASDEINNITDKEYLAKEKGHPSNAAHLPPIPTQKLTQKPRRASFDVGDRTNTRGRRRSFRDKIIGSIIDGHALAQVLATEGGDSDSKSKYKIDTEIQVQPDKERFERSPKMVSSATAPTL